MRRTLAAMLVAATMLWVAAPALATSHQSARPPATQSQAPSVQSPSPSAPSPSPGVQSPSQASKKVVNNKETASSTTQMVIKDLEQAKMALQKESKTDAKGHHAKAIQSIDQALRELRMAAQTPTK
ncbi:MAG: hypothetical protein HYZ81_12275 [Nitrospinae bacterium]|nr:hypothetical protein [Nitrospinota bacterium]